jgi:hypothetical protein
MRDTRKTISKLFVAQYGAFGCWTPTLPRTPSSWGQTLVVMGKSEKASRASTYTDGQSQLVWYCTVTAALTISPIGRPGSSKHAKGKGKGLVRDDDLTKVLSSSSNKIDLVHLEEVRGIKRPKLNKKQKLRRHCARFWCCYVLGAVIMMAIALPVL